MAGVFKMRPPDDAESIRRIRGGERREGTRGRDRRRIYRLEAAENLHARGIRVTVIDFASQILPNLLDPEMAFYAKKHLLSQGIRVITGTSAEKCSVRTK